MSGLQQNFWDTCFPEVDEGDQEGRANAIEWLDKQVSWAVQEVPLTSGTNGLSFFAWEDSKRFDIPENLDTLETADQEKFSQLRAQAEAERRTTGDMWRKAKAQSRRAFYEQLNFTLDECWAAYQALDKTIEEKFDSKQMPGMNALKKILDTIRTAIQKIVEEKRKEEPDAVEAGAETGAGDMANGEASLEGYTSGGAGVATATGAVRSRQDALKRLADVAEFFRKTEPHSPVSYLVQRAVKWGNMPLSDWLGEVIKDENVLGQLRETLGFGSYTESDASAYAADSSGSSDSTPAGSSESSW
jgi:type VI secretion system protein ImpA